MKRNKIYMRAFKTTQFFHKKVQPFKLLCIPAIIEMDINNVNNKRIGKQPQ